MRNLSVISQAERCLAKKRLAMTFSCLKVLNVCLIHVQQAKGFRESHQTLPPLCG